MNNVVPPTTAIQNARADRRRAPAIRAASHPRIAATIQGASLSRGRGQSSSVNVGRMAESGAEPLQRQKQLRRAVRLAEEQQPIRHRRGGDGARDADEGEGAEERPVGSAAQFPGRDGDHRHREQRQDRDHEASGRARAAPPHVKPRGARHEERGAAVGTPTVVASSRRSRLRTSVPAAKSRQRVHQRGSTSSPNFWSTSSPNRPRAMLLVRTYIATNRTALGIERCRTIT